MVRNLLILIMLLWIFIIKTLIKVKAEFSPPLTDNEYRNFVSPILDEILEKERDNIVIAMPPSGLFPAYYRLLEKHKDLLTIELKDNLKSIMKRLIYFVDDRKTWPIITDNNRNYYLNELKEDYKYYKAANQAAKLSVHLGGRNIDEALIHLDHEIKKWINTIKY